MNKYFKRTRYNVRAKRRDTDEKWSEWTKVNSFRDAEKQVAKAENAGYSAKIEVTDKSVEELWKILENTFDSKDGADAILNAGFRKPNEVIEEFIRHFNNYIGNCTFTAGQTFDIKYALDKAMTEMTEPCTTCKNFVFCEPDTTGICDKYEEVEDDEM